MAIITYNSGTLGTINGTAVADTITISGIATVNPSSGNTAINALDGNDTLIFTDNATVNGNVFGDLGDNVFTVSGNAAINGPGGVYGGLHTFQSSGLTASDGDSTVNISNNLGETIDVINVYGGNGNDTFNIGGDGVVNIGYWVTGNGGNDTITLTGTVNVGVVEGDGGAPGVVDGDDIITFAAGSNITGRGIQGQDGDDIIQVYGSGSLSSGVGGTRPYAPGGAFFDPGIDGGAGADQITVGETFTVSGYVSGGTGDDQITIQDSAVVTGTISGGDGTDTITISSNGGNFTVDGGTGGTDNDTLDLTGIHSPTNKATISETTDADGDSTSGTVTFEDGTVITFSEIENLIVCFAAGTEITTIAGKTSVEALEIGDLVLTQDHGYQPVRWIGRNRLSNLDLRADPSLYPVRIAQGALGGGLPIRDLLVSPQHRVLVNSAIAQRMFGQDEILVAAKHLVAIDGIDIAYDVDHVEYVHFLCEQHEVVFAEGAPSESLYTGKQALASISPEALAEIYAIFPALMDMSDAETPASARYLAGGRKGRKLAARHFDNRKPLLSPIATATLSTEVNALNG